MLSCCKKNSWVQKCYQHCHKDIEVEGAQGVIPTIHTHDKLLIAYNGMPLDSSKSICGSQAYPQKIKKVLSKEGKFADVELNSSKGPSQYCLCS